MKDRLMKIITSEGLTSTLLAEEIGVQRSGIQHILSGRNYPSYDFLQKLLTRFPKLNAEWLILGQGSMYKSTIIGLPDLFAPVQKTSLSPTLPMKDESHDQQQPFKKVKPENRMATQPSVKLNPNSDTLNEAKLETLSSGEGAQTKSPGIHPKISTSAEPNKVIEKIIILYSDKTFASYFPE